MLGHIWTVTLDPSNRTRSSPGRAAASARSSPACWLNVDTTSSSAHGTPRRSIASLESLSAHGSRVVPVAGDVVDASVRARLVDAARGPRRLESSSSTTPRCSAASVRCWTSTCRASGSIFPVNVGAPMALIQLAAPLLAERHGLIVNITSDAAQGAYPGWGPYGASKAALELLTRTLAAELRRARNIGRPRRSRRHADAHAPGGLSGRGHLRSAAARGHGPVLELAVRSESRTRARRAVRRAAGRTRRWLQPAS